MSRTRRVPACPGEPHRCSAASLPHRLPSGMRNMSEWWVSPASPPARLRGQDATGRAASAASVCLLTTLGAGRLRGQASRLRCWQEASHSSVSLLARALILPHPHDFA